MDQGAVVSVPRGRGRRGRAKLFGLSSNFIASAAVVMLVVSMITYDSDENRFSKCSARLGVTASGCPSGGVYKCILSSLPYWLTLAAAITVGISSLVSLLDWDLPSLCQPSGACLVNSTCLAIQLGVVGAIGYLSYLVLHHKDPIMHPESSNRGGYCCCNSNTKTKVGKLFPWLIMLSGVLFILTTVGSCGSSAPERDDEPSPPETTINTSPFAAVTRPDNSSPGPKPWPTVAPPPLASSTPITMYGSNAYAMGPVTRY